MSSLPASIKWIGSKATKKRLKYHFPHYQSIGDFCCHRYQSFIPICLKTLRSLSPPPVMLHIKFDQDWPTGLRDNSSSKKQNFRHSRASNSKVSSLIWPEVKFFRTFMSVLVISIFDDDSIKNERANMETASFRRSRAANSVVSGPIWPKFELVRDFMHVLVTCKYKKYRIKSNREKVETSIISRWGLSVAMETRVLIQSAPKPYTAFLPPLSCYK